MALAGDHWGTQRITLLISGRRLHSTSLVCTLVDAIATYQLTWSNIGTSLTWVGSIPAEYSHNASSASYSIDGGPSTVFQLNGLPVNTTSTLYNEIFFTTPELPLRPHNLLVTYLGNDSQTPLVLSNVLFMNATISVSSDSSNTDPIAANAAYSISSDSLNTGATVGGVVGGVLGLLTLLALAFFSIRRRRRQQKQNMGTSHPDISPFISNDEKPSHPPDSELTLVTPFMTLPDHQTTPHQNPNLTLTKSKPSLAHSRSAGPLGSSAHDNKNKEPRPIPDQQTTQNTPRVGNSSSR